MSVFVQPSEHEKVVPQLNLLSRMLAPPSLRTLALRNADVWPMLDAALVSTEGTVTIDTFLNQSSALHPSNPPPHLIFQRL